MWNRDWSPAVREAITQRPAELQGLRVLIMETGPVRGGGAHASRLAAADLTGPASTDGPATPLTAVEIALAPALLRGVRVVPVLRLNDELPGDATWRRFLALVAALRADGVLITQLEVDFDTPTAALGAYVAWLESTRPGLSGLARSVTALPTWVAAPEVPALAAAVDEVVLQVHTARAPVLFDGASAVADVQRWARTSGRPFRVALPAYRTQTRDGEDLAAVPSEVAQAMKAMESERAVTGFVFFRLGHAEDRGAWSLATLRAVVQRAPLDAKIAVRLAFVEPGLQDVWLDNEGPVDALAPQRWHVEGQPTDLVATTGYQRFDDDFLAQHPPWLRPGEHIRVGFVRGENLHVTPR